MGRTVNTPARIDRRVYNVPSAPTATKAMASIRERAEAEHPELEVQYSYEAMKTGGYRVFVDYYALPPPTDA